MSIPIKKTKVTLEENLDVVIEEKIDFPARSVREVWHSVFDKLDEKDKSAFSGACADWHDWKEGKRTQFLFQEVAPTLLDDLPHNTLLENRKYCKSWKETVDNHTQSHPLHVCLDFENDGIEWKRVPQFVNCLSSSEKVNGFMNEMKTHQGNPFPGRCTHLMWEERIPSGLEAAERLCREYWTNVTQLLEKFGTQVHFVAIVLAGSQHLGIELDHILRACLRLLPNLKGFRVIGGSRAPENQLIEFYQPGQLPQLEHLETLEVFSSDQQLMEQLLNFCCIPSKLKKLEIVNSTGCQQELQHLNSLEVLAGRFPMAELERFSSLPLQSLQLSQDSDFELLFNTLAAFRETLTQLKIDATIEEPQPAERSGFRFNLPKLRKLEMFEYTGSLDLFVQLPALAVLAIDRYHLKSEQGETELVQVSGFEDRMMESNIWSLMPSLQKLKLDFDDITLERNL